MFRWKEYAVLVAVIALSFFFIGCRKEKKEPLKKPPRAKEVKSPDRIACEKAVGDYLDAVASEDYEGAVEFIDVREMLEKRDQERLTAWPETNEAGMKQAILTMMRKAGQLNEGKALTYEIVGSRVTDGKGVVEVEVFRDGKPVDVKEKGYRLTKRDRRWKLSWGTAIRALMPPAGAGFQPPKKDVEPPEGDLVPPSVSAVRSGLFWRRKGFGTQLVA
jgi:hypothetical protein